MLSPIRILLQTTLLPTENDWCIHRFSLLRRYLESLVDEAGNPLCAVTARDRYPDETGNDPVLTTLDRADFDELWLFALDLGEGLTADEAVGIQRFYQQGGGLLTTRDHQDMGISLLPLGEIGAFHYFHSQNLDPDETRCCIDDPYTTYISFPNYHSGRNGDYQTITPVEPVHDLLKTPTGELISLFPSHPHEGAVGVPAGIADAQVVATGKSAVTGREFNLVVAGDRPKGANGSGHGRLVAQSTFHHFVDYNWDIAAGCPTFVDEPPGDGMTQNPKALQDIHTYVRNLVLWLRPG